MKRTWYLVIALACVALNAGAGEQSPKVVIKKLKLHELTPGLRRFEYERPDLFKTALKLCSSDWHNNGRTGQAA
jgi:hypothetical protein